MYQLLDVFVAPLTATMTVLLYLKSRQAGGELLQLPESAASPLNRWQRNAVALASLVWSARGTGHAESGLSGCRS